MSEVTNLKLMFDLAILGEKVDFTGALKNTIRMIMKRPFIIIFFSIMALVYSVVDSFLPGLGLLSSWSTFTWGEFLGDIVLLLQLLLKFILTPKGLLAFFGVLTLGSLLIGALFSGVFWLISNALNEKDKVKGEFLEGMKKYFIKVAVMSFIALFLSSLFVVFLLVAAVPAIIVTKAAIEGKAGFYLAAVIVDFITLGVLFFGLMFFRIYLAFWYPATLNHGKVAFRIGKKTADLHFWALLRTLFIFDVAFILFQWALTYSGGTLISLISKWVFYTLFFGIFTIYVFALFKSYTNTEVEK